MAKLTKKQIERKIKRTPEEEFDDTKNERSYHLIIAALIVILILIVSTFAFYIYRKQNPKTENFEDMIPPSGREERGNFSDLLESCSGLSEGDSCGDDSMSGVCELSREGNLVCVPERIE